MMNFYLGGLELVRAHQKTKDILLFVFFAILLSTLFINVGMVPFFAEEPRRALIAQEMMLQDNLLVPTEMGELYYKKPPVFNWLLIASFRLWGSATEMAARIVTILSLVFWGVTNFLILRKYTSVEKSFYSSLFLVISADIYFYFSMLAEIDIFYSFITYSSFLCGFHFYKKNQPLWLFLSVYSLNALGFLTKGFPSVVFSVLTVFAVCATFGVWKKFISWQHGAGIALFIIVAGGFFLLYSRHHPLDPYFEALWRQSSKRTVLENDLQKLSIHFFLFPLVILKDLLPATLLLPFVIRKGAFGKIWSNDLMRFMLLLFAANIIIYWWSPGTRSRYVYMLYPLPITIIIHLFIEYYSGLREGLELFFSRLLRAVLLKVISKMLYQ